MMDLGWFKQMLVIAREQGVTSVVTPDVQVTFGPKEIDPKDLVKLLAKAPDAEPTEEEKFGSSG